MSSEPEQRPLFTPFLIHNIKVLQYFKDISCLSWGSACGIFQLKAINGMLFFIVTSIISSLLYHYTMTHYNSPPERFTLGQFYVNTIKDVYIGNIGRQVATFTMMWCLVGALIS